MLNVKEDPVGIDVYIRKFQEKLYSSLMETWGLNPENADDEKRYQCYGRCYRNKKSNGYVAEVFESGKDYKEVYWNDTLSAISFFGISDSIEHNVAEKANVHLVFFVDLKKLKPSINSRADEEVRADVIKLVQAGLFGFKYESMDLWLENVLKEYSGSYRDERLKAVDMHPVHCFRLNFSLNYNINKTYCP